MARYIDAELLIDKLEEKMRTAQEPYQLTDGEKNFNFGLELATEIAFNMQTADVVEVVRCKDCKWYDPTSPSGTMMPIAYECKRRYKAYNLPEFYCAYGERRTDEEPT